MVSDPLAFDVDGFADSVLDRQLENTSCRSLLSSARPDRSLFPSQSSRRLLPALSPRRIVPEDQPDFELSIRTSSSSASVDDAAKSSSPMSPSIMQSHASAPQDVASNDHSDRSGAFQDDVDDKDLSGRSGSQRRHGRRRGHNQSSHDASHESEDNNGSPHRHNDSQRSHDSGVHDVAYDFSAWNSFRRSLPPQKQEALRQSLANSRRLSFRLASFNGLDDSSRSVDHNSSDVAERSVSEGCALMRVNSQVGHSQSRKSSMTSTTSSLLRNGGMQSRKSSMTSINSDGLLRNGGLGPRKGSVTFSLQPSFNDDESAYDPNCPTWPDKLDESERSTLSLADLNIDPSQSWELSEEEQIDLAEWWKRLGDDRVFAKGYELKERERKEMDAIAEFLDLKDPNKNPDYLKMNWQKQTRDAISSIFYPAANQRPSVLLKRGPVLVDGEERELLLFTDGFVLSRVELDTLVSLLLDASSGRAEDVTAAEVAERFGVLDTNESGSLDRSEIRDFFRGMGMALSDGTLDDLMNRFDHDSDGTISLDEFKSMMYELPGNNTADGGRRSTAFWRNVGRGLKKALSTRGVTRKLDLAFRISDVARVEHMADDVAESKESQTMLVVDPELAPLTLAVYVKEEHIPRRFSGGNMGRQPNEPLMIMCAKPGHVEAWAEAFRVLDKFAAEQSQDDSAEGRLSLQSNVSLDIARLTSNDNNPSNDSEKFLVSSEDVNKFEDEVRKKCRESSQRSSMQSQDDANSADGDPEALEKMNVAYDFSAWNEFRTSLPSRKQAAFKQSLAASRKLSFHLASFNEDEDETHEKGGGAMRGFPSFDEDGGADDSDRDFFDFDPPVNDDGDVTNHQEDADDSEWWELSDDERFDLAAWRMRLEVDLVFSQDYTPKKWERKEMNAIIEFLAMKNPATHPEYLNNHWQLQTRDAVSSIFFPQPGEHKSVLLKRGPVLVDGEERELMLFTNGFVLSNVELDTLVNLLLDASSGRVQTITTEEIQERFTTLDTDESGCLDRSEIRDFFRGMGMALSDSILEDLMKRFDHDSDGTISLEEFKTMMYELQGRRGVDDSSSSEGFWQGIGGKLKRALSTRHVTRKLDAAYHMSNVVRVENVGESNASKELKMFVDPELVELSLAVYLEDEGKYKPRRFSGGSMMNRDANEPLVIMCAKPGHVEAWAEAFRICTEWQRRNIDIGASETQRLETSDAENLPDGLRCSTIDWGQDDDKVAKTSIANKKGNRGLKWQCSTVDWG